MSAHWPVNSWKELAHLWIATEVKAAPSRRGCVCANREVCVAFMYADNSATKHVSSRSYYKDSRDRNRRRTTHPRAAQDNHDPRGSRYGAALPRGKD